MSGKDLQIIELTDRFIMGEIDQNTFNTEVLKLENDAK